MFDIALTRNHFTDERILFTDIDRLDWDLTIGLIQGTLSQIRWEQV